VILEPGGGGSAASMGLIAPAAARDSRVCVYDRAGRGWSDPADTPLDGARVATDLHTLLTRAHVPGPYVLAGHSFGGLYAMTFAARFPEEVAGLVLVDSTAAEDKPLSATEPDSYSVSMHASSLFATTSRLGLGRVLAGVNYGELPARYRDDARATFATPKAMGGVLEEYLVAGRSTAAAAALRSLGAKPLVVLTATVGTRRGWVQAQNEMAELSTNSAHRFEAGASHVSFVDDPDHAASVVRAIHDVVASARTGAPLTRH
jgi:pimeloyl-ACP methyl ester carboxylesterase